jgi:cyclophilin family peptidyl-prolyl cis-trans isomerase
MKRFVGLSLLVVTLPLFAASATLGNPQSKQRNPVIELVVANRGTITIELFQKDAPKTVAHILDLVKRKFYDGILIHRVEPNFVVQAGDPQTKTRGVDASGIGTGGSGKNIPFETNNRTHEAGTLGMALSAPRSATGDSQWFINLSNNNFLDGNYCVFGKVTKGMDVVRKIERGDKIVRMSIVKPK